jgi:hypothetical protein
MSTAEVRALLRSAETPCVRLHRRTDESVITANDLPPRRSFARRLVLIAASWFGFIVLIGCRDASRTQQPTMGKPAPFPGGRQELGKIAVPDDRPTRLMSSPNE